MSEFKFSCPKCHQHIKAGDEFVSRQIECPGCHASLIVPPPPKADEAVPAATLIQPASQPQPATPPQPTAPAPDQSTPPTATTADAPAESATAQPGTPPSPSPVTIVPPINDTRVAVLTPEIKLAIIRDMRDHLKDPAHWLPGKNEGGHYNYAARQEGDRMVPVDPTDASATHLSLFGAAMLAFHRHNVTRVTTGRQKFLDEEMMAAIHHTLGRPQDGKPVSEAGREALTHAQCLAVLDTLEKRRQQDAKSAQKKNEEQKIEHLRLADLLKKMDAGSPVRAEEVVCALYYEVEELKQRIEELETKAGGPKPS